MAIMINDSSRYAAAAAGRALSLAIGAEVLADEIDALHRDIRAASDETVRWADFRCDTASGWVRQAGTGLQDTAGHLGRIAPATVTSSTSASASKAREPGLGRGSRD
jgi:hypothetical protein